MPQLNKRGKPARGPKALRRLRNREARGVIGDKQQRRLDTMRKQRQAGRADMQAQREAGGGPQQNMQAQPAMAQAPIPGLERQPLPAMNQAPQGPMIGEAMSRLQGGISDQVDPGFNMDPGRYPIQHQPYPQNTMQGGPYGYGNQMQQQQQVPQQWGQPVQYGQNQQYQAQQPYGFQNSYLRQGPYGY